MHFLLLSCSNKKQPSDTPVKAIDLYNGVFFSVYKKALRNNPCIESNLKLLIISAKYGLLEASDHISYYDQKMTDEVASQQRYNNTTKLKALVERDKPQSMAVVMGRTYLQSVDLSDLTIPIQIVSGEIGIMLHGLKEWLEALGRGDINVN